jgi:hypothetical protein
MTTEPVAADAGVDVGLARRFDRGDDRVADAVGVLANRFEQRGAALWHGALHRLGIPHREPLVPGDRRDRALIADPLERLPVLVERLRALFLLGVILGVSVAYAGGRVASASVYAMRASDPLVLVSSTVIVALIALAATAVPAIRASRTTPSVRCDQSELEKPLLTSGDKHRKPPRVS